MRDYTAADYAMLHALETNLESWSEHFEAPPHPPEPLIYSSPFGPFVDRFKVSPQPPPRYDYILPPLRSWSTPPVGIVGVPHPRSGNLNHQAPA